MHVTFELPEPWTSELAGPIRVWSKPGFAGRVEVDPIKELSIDRKVWGERVLSRYLPEGGSVTQLDIVNSVNHRGWPLTMVTTATADAAGKRVDTRISMFYEFLYFGSVLAAIIPAAAALSWEENLREPVIEAMLQATPSFASSEVANIAELWDMGESP